MLARPAGAADDFHQTPRVAVEALLTVETFPGPIWEPACGPGAISEVLIEHGHEVISTDLVARGYGTGGVDFLLEWQPRAPNIISNPPFKLALEFAQHALALTTGKVALLLRLAWLERTARQPFFAAHPPARIWVFAARLPMMHREGWTGRKASSAIPHAWFVWEHGHHAAPTLGWLPGSSGPERPGRELIRRPQPRHDDRPEGLRQCLSSATIKSPPSPISAPPSPSIAACSSCSPPAVARR